MRTFDFFPQLATFVLRVVNDGRRRRWTQTVFLYPAPVSFFSRQHALPALPLVQVISSLSVVHVQPTRVLLICAGAEADPVTCVGKERDRKINRFPYRHESSMPINAKMPAAQWRNNTRARQCNECKRHTS